MRYLRFCEIDYLVKKINSSTILVKNSCVCIFHASSSTSVKLRVSRSFLLIVSVMVNRVYYKICYSPNTAYHTVPLVHKFIGIWAFAFCCIQVMLQSKSRNRVTISPMAYYYSKFSVIATSNTKNCLHYASINKSHRRTMYSCKRYTTKDLVEAGSFWKRKY